MTDTTNANNGNTGEIIHVMFDKKASRWRRVDENGRLFGNIGPGQGWGEGGSRTMSTTDSNIISLILRSEEDGVQPTYKNALPPDSTANDDTPSDPDAPTIMPRPGDDVR